MDQLNSDSSVDEDDRGVLASDYEGPEDKSVQWYEEVGDIERRSGAAVTADCDNDVETADESTYSSASSSSRPFPVFYHSSFTPCCN